MQIQAKSVYKGLSGSKSIPRRWKLYALKLKGADGNISKREKSHAVLSYVIKSVDYFVRKTHSLLPSAADDTVFGRQRRATR